MPKRKAEPPGVQPYLQGYWAAAWKQPRTPPKWHVLHTKEWQEEWLKGYDKKRC